MEEEMEELHVEGVAAHDDPESCVDDPQGRGEALTGACAGRAIEPRNQGFGVPTLSQGRKATIAGGASASRQGTPRGQRTRACTEPPCARTGRSHDCPPTRRGAGRSGNTISKTRPGHRAGIGASHALASCAPGRAWPNPTLDPSQEPSAVVPHAGICAGGRPKGRSLPRLYLRRSEPPHGDEHRDMTRNGTPPPAVG